MNVCVETVSPVENVPAVVCSADFADAPRLEAELDEDAASTENLVSIEIQPVVPLAMNEPVATKKRSRFARWLSGTATRAVKRPHIVHVRVEELFASVEQVLNPKLTDEAVLVGRGVVASASHEAKLQGVKIGMSLSAAMAICPKAMVVPGQYERYADFAERVRGILETFTPTVAADTDDFYLDFVGSEAGNQEFAAMLRRLQAEILEQTGLSVSIGAARTKVVASMASRTECSRGLRVVLAHEEEPFLASLPVRKLPGIGDAQAALFESGVSTIGQLRLVPKPALKAAFGEVIGERLWLHARGRDERVVALPSGQKSLSREATLEDGTVDLEFLGCLLEYLTERIGRSLQETGKQADTIGLRIRYVDQFSAKESVRLTRSTSDPRELRLAIKKLFADLSTRRVAVSHIAVNITALHAAGSPSYQGSLNHCERDGAKRNGFMLSTPCLSR